MRENHEVAEGTDGLVEVDHRENHGVLSDLRDAARIAESPKVGTLLERGSHELERVYRNYALARDQVAKAEARNADLAARLKGRDREVELLRTKRDWEECEPPDDAVRRSRVAGRDDPPNAKRLSSPELLYAADVRDLEFVADVSKAAAAALAGFAFVLRQLRRFALPILLAILAALGMVEVRESHLAAQLSDAAVEMVERAPGWLPPSGGG